MFTGETRFDETDLRLHRNLGRWIALTWRGDLFIPPKDVPYGTHLASLLYCSPGDQIYGLNVCWLVESSPAVFRRACDPLQGIEAMWRFRYETLKRFSFCPLSDVQLDALRLPDFAASIEGSLDPSLRTFRAMQHLDQFRHPGYPDDVQAIYGGDVNINDMRISGEGVWVRVQSVCDSDSFRGILLNQPVMHAATKGDAVLVRHIATDSNSVLVCCRI
jgi:hypothetical protein